MKTFEEHLMELLVGSGEYNGTPVTKDNCEYLYEARVDNMTKQEIVDLAENYVKAQSEKVYTAVDKNGIKEVIDKEANTTKPY